MKQHGNGQRKTANSRFSYVPPADTVRDESQAQLLEAQQEHELLLVENQELEEKLSRLEAQLEGQRTELRSAMQQAKSEEAPYSKQHQQKKLTIQLLKQELKKIESEEAAHKKTRSELEQSVLSATAEKDIMQRSNDAKQKELEQVRAELASQESMLVALRAEVKQGAQRLDELRGVKRDTSALSQPAMAEKAAAKPAQSFFKERQTLHVEIKECLEEGRESQAYEIFFGDGEWSVWYLALHVLDHIYKSSGIPKLLKKNLNEFLKEYFVNLWVELPQLLPLTSNMQVSQTELELNKILQDINDVTRNVLLMNLTHLRKISETIQNGISHIDQGQPLSPMAAQLYRSLLRQFLGFYIFAIQPEKESVAMLACYWVMFESEKCGVEIIDSDALCARIREFPLAGQYPAFFILTAVMRSLLQQERNLSLSVRMYMQGYTAAPSDSLLFNGPTSQGAGSANSAEAKSAEKAKSSKKTNRFIRDPGK